MVESAFKTTSNAPILCWHQLRSLWATLQYQCDHFLLPQRVEYPHETRNEKQWENIVMYKPHFLFFNEHPKDIWLNLLFRRATLIYKSKWNLNSYSQTLTLLFITYTIYPSNVPVLLCWHQLRSLWATLQYQCDHFLQPQWVKCSLKHWKEKQWE